MKLALRCPLCSCRIDVLANDSGLYRVRCSNGHDATICLQAEKYELLFEAALLAFQDGSYRYAVLDFASAFERFWEFTYWVMSGENVTSLKVLADAWKEAAGNSERQVGLYLASYLLRTGNPPPLLHQRKHVPIRNNVVHKGRFISEEDALEYGQAVIDAMWPVLLWHNEYGGAAAADKSIFLLASNENPPVEDEVITFLAINTALNAAVQKNEKPTVEAALNFVVGRRSFGLG